MPQKWSVQHCDPSELSSSYSRVTRLSSGLISERYGLRTLFDGVFYNRRMKDPCFDEAYCFSVSVDYRSSDSSGIGGGTV